MNEIALIFPGQGAQAVGMGRELYDTSPQAKEIFDAADKLLARELKQVIFEGPEEKLTSTAYCQPAILTMSIAALKAFESHAKFKGVNPRFAAGLSLGEYSALIAAGAFSFEDGLKLVSRRSLFMEEATRFYKGSMAAIIGFSAKGGSASGGDKARLEEICRETGAEIANFNSRQQTVITGYAKKVEEACEKIKQEGAKSVVPLQVSGAFHSSLMKPAAEKFKDVLSKVAINSPRIPVLSNVDAMPQTNPAIIKQNLTKQITSSVQWVDTIERIAKEGVTTFIEIGPGTVLRGLIRKIDSSLKVCNIQKPEDIENLSF